MAAIPPTDGRGSRDPLSFMSHKLLLSVAICLLSTEPCFAAPDTAATVLVRVSDLAAVNVAVVVRLDMDGQPPLSWTAVATKDDDIAMFNHIPAGRHRLGMTGPEGQHTSVSVVLVAGRTYEWLATIGSASVMPSLRLVREDDGGSTRAFDASMLESFPADDTLASVAETAVAPIIVDRISSGGLWVGEAALLAANGSSWRQATIARGELDVTDPLRTGTTLLRANHAPYDNLLVTTSTIPVWLAGPGPVLTLVPKAATAHWFGTTIFGVIPNAWQPDSATTEIPAIARFSRHRDWTGDVSGPISRRGGLFISARQVDSDRFERDSAVIRRSAMTSMFADATVAAFGGRLQWTANVEAGTAPYAVAPDPTSPVHEHSLFRNVHTTWERWTTGGTAWSASGTFEQGIFTPEPHAPATGAFPLAPLERLRDGPVPSLAEQAPGTRTRLLARFDLEPRTRWIPSRHVLRVGASTARNMAVASPVRSRTVPELVAGNAARVWEYSSGGVDTHWRSTQLSGYVSDRVTLGDRVILDGGVRADSIRADARSARNDIAWMALTPRLRARWQLDETGRFSVFGSAAEYAHRLPLDYLAYGDPAAASGLVYRWVDRNGDRLFESAERGSLVAAVGPCCTLGRPNRIDPQLRQPRTREVTGGIDSRFGGWSLRIAVVGRSERDLVNVVNTGVSADDYILRTIVDPGEQFLNPNDDTVLPVYDRMPASFGKDQYLLTNPSGATTQYRGLEVTLDAALTRHWRARFDGTAYFSEAVGANRGYGPLENDPGVLGEAFSDPNGATYARGHNMFDRQYVMKVWTAYTAPKQFVFSAVARYQDGQPFSRVVVVPDLNQGPEAVQAYRRGRTRFTFTMTVDAHVEKSISLGRARLGGIVEVFNLLNQQNEVEEDVLTTSSFRSTTAVQPPRAARAALKLSF